MITATFLLIENHRSFQVLRRKRKHREKKKIGCAQKTQPMLLKLTAKRPCRYSKNAHQFSHIAPPALAALNFLSFVCLKQLISQSIKQTFKAAMYNVGAQAAPSDFRQAARNTRRQADARQGGSGRHGGKMQANCVPSRRRTLYIVAFIILRDLTRFFNSFCRF
ncbi:hypothetical protein [Hominenteromicrobium sp.]|uniref:hypothetical protein n=1 Tax=Hominenteromicrobium sp. TaxID=3073581 RepID=UPI003AB12331